MSIYRLRRNSEEQHRSTDELQRTTKNRENPNESKEGGKDLLRPRKQRRCAAGLWYEQVDAAADGEAEARLDDGGGAQVRRCHEEEEEANETKGKNDKDP